MSKKDNLSDYLNDLYQGIAKKRENPSKNPQDFRAEIEQIETKSPEWDGKYETSDDTVIVEGGSCPLPVLVKKTVTENNKTYKASEDGADGYSEFTVAVPTPDVPELGTEGLSYVLSEDGTYYVCNGIGTATDTDIVISPVYRGLPVKEIADESFDGAVFATSASITSVSIPNSIEYIGKRAFQNCTALTSIEIPNSVTKINYYAFNGCTALLSAVIGKGVEWIGDYVFQGCLKMTTVTFANSGYNLTYMGQSVFNGCRSINAFEIPRGLTRLIFGTLYTNGGTKSGVTYQGVTSLVIPSNVKILDDKAIASCVDLASVTFEGVPDSIGSLMFDNCKKLTDITVPWEEGAFPDAEAAWAALGATVHFAESETWDGESLWAKSGTHTFVDNPEMFGEDGTILEETGRFTVRGNVPDVGEVEATCDAIYQSNGDKSLIYRVTSSVPDLAYLGVTYPFDLTAYNGTSGVWEDEGLKTVEFEEYAIMSSYGAFVWFNENTNPVGVVSEPIAALLGGDEDLLFRSGDGVLFLMEGKKVDRDCAFVALPVEASAPACDRPLAFWFMTQDDQSITYEGYEGDDGMWIEDAVYHGIKESITLPPQVQDGSATSFDNLFSHYIYDDYYGGGIERVWAKEIKGTINCKSTTSLDALLNGMTHIEKMGEITNTENVTNFRWMLNTCAHLKSAGTIDMRSAENTYGAFDYCYLLESLILKNIKMSLSFRCTDALSVDSLVGMCYELHDTTEGSNKTLTLGAANLAKLEDVYVKKIDVITDEMRAEDDLIDSKSPFVRCESTDTGAMLITEYVSFYKNWTVTG